MNPVERLNRLSEKVTQTFDPDFIFLIRPEKIQHFPARNWSRDEKIAEIKKRLNHSLMTMQWQGHEVIYSPELVTLCLISEEVTSVPAVYLVLEYVRGRISHSLFVFPSK